MENFLGYSILFIFLQFLSSVWIKSRLEKSIEHEYNKKIEEFRFVLNSREKAANISMFFAKWIKYRGNESEFLEKKELLNYYEELNRMSFELTLWINDEELLKDIMARFNNSENALEIRDILIKTRSHILRNNNKLFKANDIIIWPSEKVAMKNKLFFKN